MSVTLANFWGLLGGLLVLAYLANRFSYRTRVPDVVVLLLCGIALGPGLHWIDAARFPEVTRGVGTLALILILFTAVLVLQAIQAEPKELMNFPSLTFALILLTNALGLVATVRAKQIERREVPVAAS